MDIYVVYTQDGPEHPHMHSVHAKKELAEVARLIIIQKDKSYQEEYDGEYHPEYAPEVFIRKERLITSYEGLGQMFKEHYVWDGPTEGE
jgi:hypothetical protein